MTSNFSESFKRAQSNKRTLENDSVILLERNLNSLKRNFIDLDYKLKTEAKFYPHTSTFIETANTVSRLNTKLFIEKENLEKKAISTMCENARLEDKIDSFKFKNSLLEKELDQELNFNKRIISENLELKQNLESLERQNQFLSKKLEDLKTDIKVIEKIEERKNNQLFDAKEEFARVVERNNLLTDRLEILEKENKLLSSSVDHKKQDKLDLLDKSRLLEKVVSEKERTIGSVVSENQKLETEVFVWKQKVEAQEQHNQFLELEKKELLNSLSSSYKQENVLLAEISVLKGRVLVLERKNSEFIDNFRRLTS